MTGYGNETNRYLCWNE